MDNNPIFVGREHELDQLYGWLDEALAGQGQTVLVSGEAGTGKTALVEHFCREAQSVHADVIVAMGQCDAQTGSGTPYLPFIESLRLLTGDIREEMSDEALSEENASRLKSSMRLSVDALLAFGPDLIDVLVPGSGLLITASTFIAEQTGLAERIQSRIKRGKPSTGITQENIFEQYSNVIRQLSESNPLILVLDDLHWADSASCQLLFRLGRRIEDRPVMVIGTYRPNDIAAGRAGERHPMEPVITELMRYHGDIRLELDAGDRQPDAAATLDFVADYIAEAYAPNAFDEDFVQLIANRTEGHPLFVVELLRDLEERGWLAQTPEADGNWTLTQPVAFESLPSRVEGIIGERIGRLDHDAQEMLTVAAVEGAEFIAQVVAQVHQQPERDVVRQLSRELDRQHQLVAERGIDRVGRQRLYRFGFRHVLFQTHLYGTLGDIDRSLLHEDVGLALEELYGEHADEIAVELARHFLEAGLEDRALPYVITAGDRAFRGFANQEALDHYNRAVRILDDLAATLPPAEADELQPRLFDVLGRREEVYDRLGRRDEQAADLERMLDLASQLDESRQVDVYNRRSHYLWAVSDYEQAIEAAEYALKLSQGTDNLRIQGQSHRHLGRAMYAQANYDVALQHFTAATELFEVSGASEDAGEVLIDIGTVYSEQGAWEDALDYLQSALEISRELDRKWEQAFALDNLGIVYHSLGDYTSALAHSHEALDLAREIGSRYREVGTLINLGIMLSYVGDYEQATDLLEQALAISRDIRSELDEVFVLINRADIECAIGQYEDALAHLNTALSQAQGLGRPYLIAHSHLSLATVYNARRMPGDATLLVQHAVAALETARDAGIEQLQVLALSWLAVGHLAQGELDSATQATSEAVRKLDHLGTLEAGLEQVYFNHFRVLRAAGRAGDAREALHRSRGIVSEAADQIADPSRRQSFLGRVPLNRQILEAAADQG